ncbi:hypothetical protein SAMD00019534_120570, partial [Acytostelium subglobosum LB1]|uniref:hypothetical protein n=1 Tax=Acytostelium subglobosum LB1 TaxID=1410327 RepID=UPI000644AA33
MRIVLLIIVMFTLYNVTTSYAFNNNNINNQTLNNLIDNILSECYSDGQCFGETWGITIDQYNPSTKSIESVYSLNSLTALTPASNTKLFTTSATFLTLGEQYTISTPFYTDAPLQVGQTVNTLCVRGQGDPSITFADLTSAANAFAHANGINQLVVDVSYYEGDPIPQSWEWEDLTASYGALPTPLIVNENTIVITVYPGSAVGQKPSITYDNQFNAQYMMPITTNSATTGPKSSFTTLKYDYTLGTPNLVFTGSIPVNHTQGMQYYVPILTPSDYFMKTFSQMLGGASNGVNTPTQAVYGKCEDTMYPSYVIHSEHLVDLLNWTLQTSDNLYAESFLRILGAFFNQTIHSNSTDTAERGLAYVQQTLQDMGVDTSLFEQVDGSGLSRQNFITTRAIIQVLEAAFLNVGDPNHDYFTLLPVAGESGTLQYRFVNTPAQSIVHAKTGSMTGVSALSGVIAPKGLPYTDWPVFFSIVANNANRANNGLIDTIMDKIVVAASEYAIQLQ